MSPRDYCMLPSSRPRHPLETSMTQVLTPLSLGELLDRTVQLYRRHFAVFVGIVALPQVLLLPLQLGNLWSRQGNGINLATASGVLLLGLLSIVLMALAQGATVVSVSRLYLNQPTSIRESYQHVTARAVTLVGLLLAVGLLCALGFILLILPGILLALRWSLVVPAAVLENTNVADSMSRSAALTAGDRVRIFGIYFVYFVLAIVFSSIWQIPVFVAVLAAGRSAANPPFWTQVVQVCGAFATNVLIGPLLTIAISLVYYDERVRKEAFDLEHLMAQMDQPTPPSALTA